MDWHGDDFNVRPKVRTDGIAVQELGDELLVFDDATMTAHNLNGAAALVWRACDGSTTISDMVARLAREAGTPEDPEVVLFALRQLLDGGLLEPGVSLPTGGVTSRRQLLKLLGAAAVAIPTVTSMVVPAAAAAALVVMAVPVALVVTVVPAATSVPAAAVLVVMAVMAARVVPVVPAAMVVLAAPVAFLAEMVVLVATAVPPAASSLGVSPGERSG